MSNFDRHLLFRLVQHDHNTTLLTHSLTEFSDFPLVSLIGKTFAQTFSLLCTQFDWTHVLFHMSYTVHCTKYTTTYTSFTYILWIKFFRYISRILNFVFRANLMKNYVYNFYTILWYAINALRTFFLRQCRMARENVHPGFL